MHVRIAGREEPDQTVSLSLVWVWAVCLGLFRQATSVQSFRKLTV